MCSVPCAEFWRACAVVPVPPGLGTSPLGAVWGAELDLHAWGAGSRVALAPSVLGPLLCATPQVRLPTPLRYGLTGTPMQNDYLELWWVEFAQGRI